MPEQQLRISYDTDVRTLNIMTANRGVTSTSLAHDYDVIADLFSEESSSKVVGLEILNPIDYLPLGTHGYDEKTDILLLGLKEDATSVEANGDLVAYWKPDPHDPDDYTLLGVDVLSARKWLGAHEHIAGTLALSREGRGLG